MSSSPNGSDQYTYSCYLDGGFSSNEVRIDLSESLREIHIQAERNKSDATGRVDQRSVSRRLQLPDDVDVHSVRCSYDEGSGRVEVVGKWKPKPKPPPSASIGASSTGRKSV